MKTRRILFPFLLCLPLFSCQKAPEYVDPKEELRLVEGAYDCIVSETTSVFLKADFTCVFSYVSGGNSVEKETSFALRQLGKEEQYGFGLMHPPLEGQRVYEIKIGDPSIGEDADDRHVRAMAKNLYLSHWYSDGQRGGKREIELSNANYCGPLYDSTGSEVDYQPPLFWWQESKIE